MALLYALALFIAVWRRAIAISDKLRPTTWAFLTLCSLIFLVESFCVGGVALVGKVPDFLRHKTSTHSPTRQAQGLALIPMTSFGRERVRLEYDPPDFRKLFEREPVKVEPATPLEFTDSQRRVLFWITLFGMIVSPLTSIATATLAWIAFHRKRAEALLLTLELEKRRLEVKHLRLELVRAKEEREKSETVPSKIVIPN